MFIEIIQISSLNLLSNIPKENVKNVLIFGQKLN